MKTQDKDLLRELQQNARLPLTHLAQKTNMPVSTVYDKLKKLEERYIQRHTSLIDFEAIGYTIKIAYFLKCGAKSKAQDFLLNHPHINSLHRVSHESDFYFEGIFRTMGQHFKLVEGLEPFQVHLLDHHFIEEDLKKEGFCLN